MDNATMQLATVSVPEVIVTLKFAGIDQNPDVPPTYEVVVKNSGAGSDPYGGIDFLLKEGRDVKLTFQIDQAYQGKVQFAPYDNTSITFNALLSRDSITGATKVPPTAKNFSNQFDCDGATTNCAANYNRNYIVTNYDNEFFKGPYTRYGFRYEVKVNGTWTPPKLTPDPGIKNGGVNLAALLGILAVLGVSIAAVAYWVIQLFRRRDTTPVVGKP